MAVPGSSDLKSSAVFCQSLLSIRAPSAFLACGHSVVGLRVGQLPRRWLCVVSSGELGGAALRSAGVPDATRLQLPVVAILCHMTGGWNDASLLQNHVYRNIKALVRNHRADLGWPLARPAHAFIHVSFGGGFWTVINNGQWR